MGLTSLQVCIDSSDWLQGTIHDDEAGLMDHGMDSSSNSPSGGDHILTCSRPLIERRLRPPHDQALKCPRCESTHTKFCYYNNYSLSQPRYFCKTCRRYWTKGGTLRNIPVGGGCRKNKKVTKKSSNDHQSISNNNNNNNQNPSSSSNSPTSLHLSIPPEIQLSHLNNILNTQAAFANPNHNFMGMPLDFMESKLEGLVGSSRINNYDFMGNGLGELVQTHHGLGPNFNDLCSPPPFGMSLDGNNSSFMENYQRLMLPFDHHHHHHHQGGNDHDHHNNHGSIDVKPNTKFLSLDWQDQRQGGDHEKGTYGYMNNNLGTWNGLMNGYGSSSATTNTLV